MEDGWRIATRIELVSKYARSSGEVRVFLSCAGEQEGRSEQEGGNSGDLRFFGGCEVSKRGREVSNREIGSGQLSVVMGWGRRAAVESL